MPTSSATDTRQQAKWNEREILPEKTGEKQAGGRFPRGVSGNPAGRPQGALNKTTLACQALLEGESEAITRKAVELAKKGDIQALRLCLDRILPARKDRPISLSLPEVRSAKEVPAAIGAVLSSVADGQLTPSEGQALASMLETQKRAIETAELEQRVSPLSRLLCGQTEGTTFLRLRWDLLEVY